MSTAVRTTVVAKLEILNVFSSISLTLLKSLLVSMTLTFLSNSLYLVFYNNFFTTSFIFLKSTGTVFNLSTSSLSTLLVKLFKALYALFNSSRSSCQHMILKLAKSYFLEDCNVSKPVAFCK